MTGLGFWALVVLLLVSCAHPISETRAAENSGCTIRLQQFVHELELLFPHATSVYPIQALFSRYFPLGGCEADEILPICKQSKYCSDQSVDAKRLIMVFEEAQRRLYVQSAIDRRSKNTELPFVIVRP